MSPVIGVISVDFQEQILWKVTLRLKFHRISWHQCLMYLQKVKQIFNRTFNSLHWLVKCIYWDIWIPAKGGNVRDFNTNLAFLYIEVFWKVSANNKVLFKHLLFNTCLWNRHLTSNPFIDGWWSSIPTGGNFIFCWNLLKHSMSILHRNVRFVLKTKT